MNEGSGFFGRVGVLAGGPSSEREISIRSGRAVYNALIQEGIDAVFLDVLDDVRAAIAASRINVAFIALHGRFGEDGTVQKILEDLGISYTGSGIEASRNAIDKIASKEIFIQNGIPTPRYMIVERGKPNMAEVGEIGFPMVVKPQLEGSSIGLTVVREAGSMDAAIEEAMKYGDKVLVEEHIEGRELTVGILNDKALSVIEIVAKNKVYDYSAKYSDPGTQYLVPAPISGWAEKKARGLAELAHKTLGCRSFSRIDMMMDGLENIFVLEVNTIPGMTERSLLPKAAGESGLNFNKLCVKIIEDTIEYKKRSVA